MRKTLYMPGLVALRHNPILQVFGARKANGLAPKAVVGTAMRKLAHLIYGRVKSGKLFDTLLASTQRSSSRGANAEMLRYCGHRVLSGQVGSRYRLT